jgi:hypothetical protein
VREEFFLQPGALTSRYTASASGKNSKYAVCIHRGDENTGDNPNPFAELRPVFAEFRSHFAELKVKFAEFHLQFAELRCGFAELIFNGRYEPGGHSGHTIARQVIRAP